MANLFAEQTVVRATRRFYTWGDDPNYSAAYLQTYAELNPLFPAGLFFPAGEVYASGDIIDHAEMAESRFAREYLEPQGYVDFIACNLERTASASTILTVVRHRDHGRADSAARGRMALLAPHVRRALNIGLTLNHASVAIENLSAATDALETGVLLVNAEGLLVHANLAGLRMIEAEQVARADRGRFEVLDKAAQSQIRAALAGSASGALSATASVPINAGGEYVAHVLPLTRARRREIGEAFAATAAIFLQSAAAPLTTPAETLSRRYKLTAGELRVLIALCAGQTSVAGIAGTLGIGEATVRSHLLKLYAKTGASGQADLIRMAAGYISPVSNG